MRCRRRRGRLLGDDLPLIAADVTVEHLLCHRSGIGDYLDEDTDLDESDYLMPVSVHELATTEAFVPVLDGYPTKFTAGDRVLLLQRGVTSCWRCSLSAPPGSRIHDLVHQRVCCACRHERHSLPALRCAARGCRAGLRPRRWPVALERVPPAGARELVTAGRSPLWTTCTGSGRRCSAGRS